MDREDKDDAGVDVKTDGNGWREEGEDIWEDGDEYEDGEKDGSENDDDDDNEDCSSYPHFHQQRQCHHLGSGRPRLFLVDPENLDLNVLFCLALFHGLLARELRLVPTKAM